MTPFTNTQVESVFKNYAEQPRIKLLALRELIFETAKQINDICLIEETLKWGEPSYLTPQGSTIRIGWKASEPDCCKLLFHCQTSLIRTFREIYPELDYEDNRAIRLSIQGTLDTKRLTHCVELALTYHSVKALPLLGTLPGKPPTRHSNRKIHRSLI